MTLLASQALVGQDRDELEVAGALHGQPLEVVKSITNDLITPAHAEVAIEGFFVPGVRELEGPFGEFTQYYGPKGERFVIEVTTVTHRKSPLFSYHHRRRPGTEHLMLGAVPREASFLTNMQRVFPNVLNVHLPKGWCVGRYHLIVQIKKIYEGSAKNIIFSALSMHH
jgi:2,5-furandicarboxylate decarboxylase 1